MSPIFKRTTSILRRPQDIIRATIALSRTSFSVLPVIPAKTFLPSSTVKASCLCVEVSTFIPATPSATLGYLFSLASQRKKILTAVRYKRAVLSERLSAFTCDCRYFLYSRTVSRVGKVTLLSVRKIPQRLIAFVYVLTVEGVLSDT